MSSNKSENLGLHLWEGEDDFLRTEFNENFQLLDSIYVTGSYTGSLGTKTINIGFRPRFLVIMAPTKSTSGSPLTNFFAGGETNALKDRLKFLDTGFQVTFVQGSTPMLNSTQYEYFYFAFR